MSQTLQKVAITCLKENIFVLSYRRSAPVLFYGTYIVHKTDAIFGWLVHHIACKSRVPSACKLTCDIKLYSCLYSYSLTPGALLLTRLTKATSKLGRGKAITKGIKNGWLCIVKTKCTQVCALVGGPARAVSECRDDLHNARATILNSCYNKKYRIINEIRQNDIWIEPDIPCINLTPNRYNVPATAIVYVSNDVIIPINLMTSQINTEATQKILMRARVNSTEIVLKYTDRHSNIIPFLHVQG